jgi:hypothetical protein
VGDRIVIIAWNTGRTTAQPPTLTDDNSSGTYSRHGTAATKNTSADSMWVFIRDAAIAAASSTIFTMTQSGDSGGGLAVFSIGGGGINGLSGIVQVGKQDNVASGTPSITMGAAIQTTSAVIGAVMTATNGTANTAPPTSWTEQYDQGYNTPATGIEVAYRASGETNTTVAWTAAAASAFCSILVEISATQALSPGVIDAASAIYAPTITFTQVLSPDVIDAVSAIYAPTLVGKNTLTIGLIDGAGAIYAPTLAPAPYPITLGLIDGVAAIYAPTLVGKNLLTPGLIDAVSAIYAPTLTTLNTLTIGLIDGVSAIYAPTLVGKNLVSLDLIDAGSALYAPQLDMAGSLIIGLDLIDGGAALYAPVLLPFNLVTLDLIESVSDLYAPSLVVTMQFLTVPVVGNDPVLYAPVLEYISAEMIAALKIQERILYAEFFGKRGWPAQRDHRLL